MDTDKSIGIQGLIQFCIVTFSLFLEVLRNVFVRIAVVFSVLNPDFLAALLFPQLAQNTKFVADPIHAGLTPSGFPNDQVAPGGRYNALQRNVFIARIFVPPAVRVGLQ